MTDSLLDDYDTRAFLAAGYTVVTIEARADDASSVESWVSQTLLVSGFTFLGLRVYEALVGLRVMQSMPGLDPTRLGLLGHSGGGSVVNTTVRLHPSFAAAITDHHTDYFNVADDRWVLCETVFDLIPYSDQISDPSTAPMPMKRVEYGWPHGAGPLVAFFDRHLN